MRRRDFVARTGAAFMVPSVALAQSHVPHTVFLWPGPAGSAGDTLRGFHAGLQDFGYKEGRNIIVDYYYSDGSEARLAELAAAAVAAQPDLISTFGFATYVTAKLTRTIPIVSLSGDPVGSGVAANLAHPGGNVTGMAVQVSNELVGKWLELLVEVLPRASRIGMLRMLSPWGAAEISMLRGAAERLGNRLTIDDYAVHRAAELSDMLAKIKEANPDGLIVDNDATLVPEAREIAAIGLPAIGGSRDFAEVGFLLSYGASIFEIVRHLGSYIDRILKGAKPGDLPIEQPTKFELIINLKTAKALGLTPPPALLAQADDVIE